MRYWVDSEFQDDGERLHVLSLAVVAEDSRELYAVNSEFPFQDASPWHHENRRFVLPLIEADADFSLPPWTETHGQPLR